MRVWRGIAAVAAWLLAVVLVAAVTWFAIDSAGRQVGAAGGEVVALVASSGPLPTAPRPSAGPGTAGTDGSAGAPGSPGSPGSPTVVAPTAREVHEPGRTGTSPAASPAASASASSGRPPTTATAPGSTPPPVRVPGGGRPGAPAPDPVGVLSSPGGDLLVRCAGARVSGWAVRPADGWRAEATPGPRGDLDAVFTADAGQVIQVAVVCRDGRAVFSPRYRSGRASGG